MLLEHLVHLRGGEHERLGALNGARARAVRQLVEQQSFADRFAGAERDEADVASFLALFDRDRAGDDDREEVARRALLERAPRPPRSRRE